MKTGRQSSAVAAGCMALFGLPFFLAGVFLIGWALVRMRSGQALEEWALPGIGGIAFGTAGTGILLAAWYGKRKLGEVTSLQAQHPGQPWLWDAEWAARRVRTSGRGAVVAAWIIAVIWNAVSSPIFFVMPGELEKGNTPILIGLLFPLVGLGLVVWAYRTTARWLKFGVSELELATNPVPIGGTFTGILRTGLGSPPDTMQLRLSCIRRRQGSGDDGATESILWQDEVTLSSDWMRLEAGSTMVPVVFDIPADAVPTDRESSPVSIHWRLHAEAAVAGVDYASRFDIPVFLSPDTLEESRKGALAAGVRGAMTLPFDPMLAKVTIAPGPGGGTEFRFGAARSPGAALGVTIMALLFCGVAIVTGYLGAPLLFPIIFGLFGVLLVLFAIDLWLVVTTVEIGHNVLQKRTSIAGFGWTRHIDTADIEELAMKVGMTQQDSATQSSKAWYDIALQLGDGRKVTIGRQIADRREAEWVVAEMRRAAGLDPDS